MSALDPPVSPPRIGAARVAWYATGRSYASSNGTLQDVGHFLHLGWIRGDLFRELPGGAKNEASARFTFTPSPGARRQ